MLNVYSTAILLNSYIYSTEDIQENLLTTKEVYEGTKEARQAEDIGALALALSAVVFFYMILWLVAWYVERHRTTTVFKPLKLVTFGLADANEISRGTAITYFLIGVTISILVASGLIEYLIYVILEFILKQIDFLGGLL